MPGNNRANRPKVVLVNMRGRKGMDLKPKGIDSSRISQLPDWVLSRILSSVSTLDAVRTSILSTRWGYLWRSVPNLDFNQTKFYVMSSNRDFAAFIDHLLSSDTRSSDIRKLRLQTSIESCASLMCEAMSHYNIVELDLDLRPSLGLSEVELPVSVFSSETVEVLKAELFIRLQEPTSRSTIFQSLKSLHYYMYPSDTPSIEKLISNCPVLEDLTTNGEYFYERTIDRDVLEEDVYKLKFKISAPALKTLILLDWNSNVLITISCPKLENLVVVVTNKYQHDLPNCLVNSVKHLAKAEISLLHITQDYLDRLIVLLAYVSGVKHLSLSLGSHLTCYLSKHFDNLKQLEIILFNPADWDNMIDFLKRFQYLEDLVLNFSRANWRNLAYQEDYEPFKPPEIVLVCVLSHIKTVCIRNFTGCDDEFSVIKYLLKNGASLRRLLFLLMVFTCLKLVV